MRKYDILKPIIALALLIASVAGSYVSAASPFPFPTYMSQVLACQQSVGEAGTAGTLKVVSNAGTLSNGQKPQIIVCGYAVDATVAATFQIVYGTGTNCGTQVGTVTPAFSLAAGQSLVDHPVFYTGLPPVPNGNDMCVIVGSTGPAPYIVYYAQF